MSDKNEKSAKEKPIVVRNTTDFQRLKLEKLMKNPDKPVIIPEKPKERGSPHVPDFVRNVMGSSAGAGSGEFHVYRHLRRKEYARQKYMKEKAERERLDDEYKSKLEDNKKKADERTAKKRAKRLKRKQKQKAHGKKVKTNQDTLSENSDDESSDEESSDKDTSDKDTATESSARQDKDNSETVKTGDNHSKVEEKLSKEVTTKIKDI